MSAYLQRVQHIPQPISSPHRVNSSFIQGPIQLTHSMRIPSTPTSHSQVFQNPFLPPNERNVVSHQSHQSHQSIKQLRSSNQPILSHPNHNVGRIIISQEGQKKIGSEQVIPIYQQQQIQQHQMIQNIPLPAT